jgi:glycosyltransferase involved in cell wall biosynthesis
MVTIGWVIPLISRDLVYLVGLLESLARQTVAPDETVLVSSGLSRDERLFVNREISQSSLHAQHLARPHRHSAGSNRNFGARRIQSAYVSFFDADDIPHRDRQRALLEAIVTGSPAGRSDVVLHGFSKIPRDLWGPSERALPENLRADCPRPLPTRSALTVGTRLKLEQSSPFFGAQRPLVALDFEGSAGPAAHGHITVSRALMTELRFRSRSVRRGEDVEFANSLARNPNLRMVLVDFPLAAYREGWQKIVDPRHAARWARPSLVDRSLFEFWSRVRRQRTSLDLLLHRLRRKLCRPNGFETRG